MQDADRDKQNADGPPAQRLVEEHRDMTTLRPTQRALDPAACSSKDAAREHRGQSL